VTVGRDTFAAAATWRAIPSIRRKKRKSENSFMRTDLDSNEILWGTFRDLERKYSIPRSSGYVLIQEGLIRSKLIRHKKQRGCGRRLIDMRSVEAFLNGCPEKPTAAVRRTMTKRAFASADKRAAKNGD
jgi:hypothetical protein